MYSARLVQFFMVVLSIMTVSQAAWFKSGLIGRAWDGLAARQNSATTTPPTPTTPSTAQTTTSSRITTPSNSAVTTTPSAAPTTSSTTSVDSAPGSSSNVPPTTASTPPTTTSTTASTTSSSSASVIIKTTVIVYETTDAAGQKTSVSSSATIYSTAGSSDSTGGTAEPMSESTRNTIIGVCVGVGGAIILGVVGFVLWRLRNRRRQEDDHDDLAGTSQFNHGPEKSENSGSVSGRSPFQSTLESYHAPSQANTASNF